MSLRRLAHSLSRVDASLKQPRGVTQKSPRACRRSCVTTHAPVVVGLLSGRRCAQRRAGAWSGKLYDINRGCRIATGIAVALMR